MLKSPAVTFALTSPMGTFNNWELANAFRSIPSKMLEAFMLLYNFMILLNKIVAKIAFTGMILVHSQASV